MLQNLANPLRRNPFRLYSAFRGSFPVWRNPVHGFYVLWDHDSVKRALSDPESFSSRAAPPGGTPLDWMIFLDPPRHGKLRALVARAFTPRAIQGLEPRVRQISRELLDGFPQNGVVDLTGTLADPLPLRVIAEMLGIPSHDLARLARWSDAILGLSDTVMGGARAARAIARFNAAREEMAAYLPALVEERRLTARDDLLSGLVRAEVDGERLSDREILDFFQLLLLAGSETTTNLISNTLLCLLEHPEQLARIRADPSLLPAAIEEVLRFRSPVQMVFRAARRDVTLRGRTIPEGSLVLAMVGSANRDAARFPHPSRFDITRSPNAHAAFGHGIHFCIGAALARLEARVAVGELLDRVEDLRLDGAWTPRTALNVHGPARLPVRVRLAAR